MRSAAAIVSAVGASLIAALLHPHVDRLLSSQQVVHPWLGTLGIFVVALAITWLLWPSPGPEDRLPPGRLLSNAVSVLVFAFAVCVVALVAAALYFAVGSVDEIRTFAWFGFAILSLLFLLLLLRSIPPVLIGLERFFRLTPTIEREHATPGKDNRHDHDT